MPAQRASIRDLVITDLAEVLNLPPDVPANATSLFDLPGFDSMAIVAVLDRLETALGVEVPAGRIVPEAFESLDSLTDLMATTVRMTPSVSTAKSLRPSATQPHLRGT